MYVRQIRRQLQLQWWFGLCVLPPGSSTVVEIMVDLVQAMLSFVSTAFPPLIPRLQFYGLESKHLARGRKDDQCVPFIMIIAPR